MDNLATETRWSAIINDGVPISVFVMRGDSEDKCTYEEVDDILITRKHIRLIKENQLVSIYELSDVRKFEYSHTVAHLWLKH